MKTQLLQDIDESRIDFAPRNADRKPVAASGERVAPVAPVPAEAELSTPTSPLGSVPRSFAPQPPFAASPPQPPQPPQPAGAGPATARAAVWSFKERPDAVGSAPAQAAPESASSPASAAPAAASAQSDIHMFDARDDEPPPVMPKAIEWPSRQAPPVLEPLVVEKEPDWFERWGRYAAWAICLLLVVMFAAGGMWMYRESKIENTMALLASKGAPAPPAVAQASPAPAATPAPAAIPAPVSLGSDALRQPETVAAPTAEVAPTPSEQMVMVPPEQTMQDKPPEASVSRDVAQVSTQPAVVARAPAKARPPASPKRAPAPVPEAAPAPARRSNDMAETLRQCRAMGYHSTQCIERGCYTTKYGLVCKG